MNPKILLIISFCFFCMLRQVSAQCFDQNNTDLSTVSPVTVDVHLSDVYTGTDDSSMNLAGNNYSPNAGITPISNNFGLSGIQCSDNWTVRIEPGAHGLNGNDVVTEVGGIVISLSATVSSLTFSIEKPMSLVSSGRDLNVTQVVAQLKKVRVGNGVRRAPGVIKRGIIGSLWLDEVGSQSLKLADINLANDVHADIGTCSVSPIPVVTFGNKNPGDFGHVGATSNDIDFGMTVQCDPDLNVDATFVGPDSGGNVEVFGLDTSSTATGIGIQLYSLGSQEIPTQQNLIKPNVQTPIFNVLASSPGGNGVGVTHAQFRAHLYQLDQVVTGGNISSTLTYVLSYR